eukprot:14924831-Alexandrium_andersonii.AAC.1
MPTPASSYCTAARRNGMLPGAQSTPAPRASHETDMGQFQCHGPPDYARSQPQPCLCQTCV